MALFFFGLAAMMFLNKFEAAADEIISKGERHHYSHHIPRYKRPKKPCIKDEYDCKPIWK